MLRSLGASVLVALVGCGAPPPPVVVTPASVSAPVADPQAIARLDEGERRIEVVGGDCAAACDALATIMKARIALCVPRTSACPDAERREGDAHRKVASFCAPCPEVPP